MSQISPLPYMQPLAISQPIVLDGSMSYYEFLNKLYNAIQNQVIPAVNSYDSQISEWSTKWTQHNTQIATLQSAVAGHTSSIQNLSTRMSEAEEDITTVEGEIATTNANVTALGTRVTASEGNITTLNGRLDTDEALISNLSLFTKWKSRAKITPLMGTLDFFTNKLYDHMEDSSLKFYVITSAATTVDVLFDCQEDSTYDVGFSLSLSGNSAIQFDFMPIDNELDGAYVSVELAKMVTSTSTLATVVKTIHPDYHYTMHVEGLGANDVKWYTKGKLSNA